MPLLVPGTALGDHKIGDLIGSGGMGAVYRAYDQLLRRAVALKVLTHGRSGSLHEQILLEARAACALNHPGICTIYRVDHADGHDFIVMEFVDGRRLSELIPAGGLPLHEVLAYGIQIADALAHAHEQGVVHRDLKGANILVTKDGRVKVVDFGLAERLEPAAPEAATATADIPGIRGTLGYMAPEVLRGESPTHVSDLWAFGVLLYEAVTGVGPFGGRTTFEQTAEILRGSFRPIPAQVPVSVRTIITRCLAREAGQRCRSAREIRAALEAVQSDAVDRDWWLSSRPAAMAPAVASSLTPPETTTPAAPHTVPEQHASEAVAVDGFTERNIAGAEEGQPIGDRTVTIRETFDDALRKYRRRNVWMIASATLVALGAGGFAYYTHQKNIELERQLFLLSGVPSSQQQQALLEELNEDFYSIKEKDVDLLELEQKSQTGDVGARAQREKLQGERLAQIRKNEAQLNDLVYKNLGEIDRLILRVTRRLGDSEVAAPQGYVNRVKEHIEQWRSTRRFADSLQRAQKYGYIDRITKELLAHDLSPDFFYLAMQESSFDPSAVGPRTRYGYAKGMWQFIPETGERFGLKSGPFKHLPRTDAADERQDWNKATTAAAKYIKEIYTTDAKTSGLLVIASYNWGEHRIIDRVKELPPHPRDRNFWKLIERFSIPDETYNYVFNIIAAAVIGESPGTFGFDFPNPLASALRQYETSR